MAVGMLVAEAELVFDPEDVAYTVGGMLERHPLPFQTFASAASASLPNRGTSVTALHGSVVLKSCGANCAAVHHLALPSAMSCYVGHGIGSAPVRSASLVPDTLPSRLSSYLSHRHTPRRIHFSWVYIC